MIKVVKPVVIPAILLNQGRSETIENCKLYDLHKADYNSNKAKFTILSSIYNAPIIKTTLKKAQKNKCCFCEKSQNDEFGAVEHYRPKGGYKSKRKDNLKKPGYYWQAYVWDNLFFVCGPCNTKKGNIFPLKDETKRARNHNNKLNAERPLLLNPAGRMDPRKHIKFNDEFPFGVSEEGKQTIEICKLDREGLNKERKLHLNEVEDRVLIVISGRDPLAIARAEKYLKSSVKDDAKFSAMTIDYIDKSPILIT